MDDAIFPNITSTSTATFIHCAHKQNARTTNTNIFHSFLCKYASKIMLHFSIFILYAYFVHIFFNRTINSVKFIHPSGSMESQRVNCRRRNLPAELKVEIVDCLPLENAVHFLANVPNRLIIHHCAPRVRRILKMVYQIADDYAGRLPDPDSHGRISRKNWHNYTPKMDIFLRYGAAHCEYFTIRRGTRGGFVRYPADFFNDLIKHYYETKVPDKAVRHLDFELPLTNRAPWPAALVKPRAGEMKVEVSKVDNVGKFVRYILRNKHNPGIAFKLYIYFQRDAKCYQQMTRFFMVMARVQSRDGAQLCVFGAQAGNILDSMSGDTN